MRRSPSRRWGSTGAAESVERALAEARRRGGLSRADADALAGLGIDVSEIVSRVEEAHGEGALRRRRRRRAGRAQGLVVRVPGGHVLSLRGAKDVLHGVPAYRARPARTGTSATSTSCWPSPPAPASPRRSWRTTA